MARQYKLKTFLRHIDDDLLREYVVKKGLQEKLPDKNGEEDPADYWERAMKGFPQQAFDAVEIDFQDINEMAVEDGISSLLQLTRDSGSNVAQEIEEIENEYNQAFHFFLKHPEVFGNASTLHWVEELRSKKERVELKRKPAAKVKEQKESLQTALKSYFLERDGRGRHCEVEVFVFQNRVCFIAYPEDYPKTDWHYEGKDKRIRARRRSCFEIVYIYDAGEGRLGLFAKGGDSREQELMDLFNRVVLEDEKPLPKKQKLYNLNKFFDPTFDLPRRFGDDVEDIRVRSLRFDSKYGKERITLDLKEGGLKPMQELMKFKGMKEKHYNITQARIYIKFPGKNRKGGVTIQITTPDKCNLNDSPTHLKAREYLTHWALENAPTATQPV